MAIKSDYHMHTSFSGDSTAPMEQMILKGIELGLNSICFTEHMDMDFVYEQPSEEGMFDLNTDSYLYDFIKYKEKYSGQIQLLFGVELGAHPRGTKFCRERDGRGEVVRHGKDEHVGGGGDELVV